MNTIVRHMKHFPAHPSIIPMFHHSNISIAAILFILAISSLEARDFQVGPARAYTLPSAVAGLVADGDTVSIDAGDYVDCATWTRNNLLIRGVGGYAHVRDKCCGGKAIWVIQGNNTTLENIEFSGATVPDQNGAGIRQEGANLTIRHCYFHDCEDGILAGDNAGSTILIEYTEFDSCGFGDGYSHNMYINHVKEFTLRFCFSHHARVGHDVKSRAYANYILYNRISDEADGTASRNIDLPNGGFAVIMGNVIQHGPMAENSNAIEFGLEGLTNPSRSLFLSCNTIVNERGGSFVNIPASGVDTLKMVDNIFAGNGALLVGKAAFLDTAANLLRASPSLAGFADAAKYDYRLLPASPAVNAGTDPGYARSVRLLSQSEYVHPANGRARLFAGAVDIGAYEYISEASLEEPPVSSPASFRIESVYPNPATGAVGILVSVSKEERISVRFLDLLGRERGTVVESLLLPGTHDLRLDASPLSAGCYFVRMVGSGRTAVRMVIVRP